jgi:3-oxoacyl-[acyl-carrier-protein] synthase-1
MKRRVAITGIGIISAIGNNVSQTLESLLSERHGIGPLRNVETIHKEIQLAEVKFPDEELLRLIRPRPGRHYSRTAVLGIIAATEAWRMSRPELSKSTRTGLVCGTTVGGMCLHEKYHQGLSSRKDKEELVIHFDCADSTEEIADLLDIHDFLSTIATACSSSANAIMMGAKLIKHGFVDRVLAGGTDSLTKFTISGFNVLEILDGTPCKPFDRDRRGLTLGEGAGFVMLEAEDMAYPEAILCMLTGYANANDAHDHTASSPDGNGAYLAMSGALRRSGVSAAEIDYINAHGTGTVLNDSSESRAIKRLFGESIPPFSSTKSYTGHALGAAGGIEAVISVLCMKEGFIPPNLRYRNPIAETSLIPQTSVTTAVKLRNVLSNSFGFGGNSTSLVFSERE